MDRDQPAFYQADQGEYDRDSGIAMLTGHVEFWQNDRVLLADRVTYDRNSNIAAAYGHVVLMEPGGQTVFSDYAELSGGLKDGVMSGMRALLPEGGRLVANGARRTDANINELSRVVYSTCDLCADDPSQPPLWQIRAAEAAGGHAGAGQEGGLETGGGGELGAQPVPHGWHDNHAGFLHQRAKAFGGGHSDFLKKIITQQGYPVRCNRSNRAH